MGRNIRPNGADFLRRYGATMVGTTSGPSLPQPDVERKGCHAPIPNVVPAKYIFIAVSVLARDTRGPRGIDRPGIPVTFHSQLRQRGD